MALKLFNTLGRQKQEFVPLSGNEVKLYTCGPTIYNHVHIGNLRAYISADILKRALEFNGYDVNWVMNVTDVDDKTIANSVKKFGSKADVESLKEYTNEFFQTFLSDLEKINVQERDIQFVKITEKIADIQEYIELLLKKGYAYKAEDRSTYFNVGKYQQDFGDYASLVGEKFLEGKKTGTRINLDEYKKDDVADFALWKATGPDDALIYWDHPVLGKGRPGWHIECTLINYLKFEHGTDIHTGGVDLIFPHHTNEIAQAQPIYKPFVKYWVHSEHILVENQKMAKSANNFFTLKDLEAEGSSSGLALRYLMLQSHYRSKLNITKDSLISAKNGLANIMAEVARYKMELQDFDPNVGLANVKFVEEFKEAINDDLNTPEALAIFSALLNSDLPTSEKLQTAYKFDEVLGLNLENAPVTKPLDMEELDEEISQLLKKREEARAAKDYASSDALRKELESKGYEVLDTANGSELRRMT